MLPFPAPRDPNFWQRGVDGPVDPNFWRAVRLQLADDALVDPFRQNPWVFAAVRKIARSVARAPWIVFREGTEPKNADAFEAIRRRYLGIDPHFHADFGSAPARRYMTEFRRSAPWVPMQKVARAAGAHPLETGDWYELFRDVNPQLQGRQLWNLTTVNYASAGEGFWILQARGKPIRQGQVPDEIWVRSRNGWKPKLDPKTQLVAAWDYTYRVEGETAPRTQRYEPHQVIQFADFGTAGDLRGQSPLEACGIELRTYHQASLFNEAFFKNGAVLGGYLWTDRDLPRTLGKELLEEFRQKHKGTDLAFEPDILTHGLKWQQASTSQKDMEYPKGMEMLRDAILSALNVPKHEVGVTAELNRSIAETERASFWYDSVIPILQFYEDVTASKLFAASGQDRTFGMFDLSVVEALREDLGMKLDSAKKLLELTYPPNEINERLQLGMRKTPWGTTGYLPGNAVPAGELPAGPDDDEEDDGDGEEAAPRPSMRARAIDLDRWGAHERALLIPGEAAYEKRYLRFLAKVTSESLRRIAEVDPTTIATASPLLFDADEAKTKLGKALGNIYERLYAAAEKEAEGEVKKAGQGAAVVEAFTTAGEARSPSDPSAIELLADLKTRIRKSVDTIREQLARVLDEGIRAGEDREGLRERVRSVFGTVKRRVHKFIRRHEVSSVINGAREIVFDKHEIENFDWLTARDEHVRPTHVAYGEAGSRPKGHNWAEEIGEAYVLRRPHDPSAPLAETAACRCVLVPALPEEERAQ